MLLDDVRDAARCAAKASFPTDILVIKTGFRVIARNGHVSNGRTVTFQDLDLAPRNLLVDAVHAVNRAVA